MFNAWGKTVARHRVVVLVVAIIAMALLAGAGALFGKPFTQGGFEDPNSGWATAEHIEKEAYGRDAIGDVVVLYHAPPGEDVDHPAFLALVSNSLKQLRESHPEDITGITDYADNRSPAMANRDAGVVVASIQVAGEGDEILENYRHFENEIPIPGIQTQIAGLQPVAGALDQGMTNDLRRAEVIALPLVFVLLVVVFGGVVAAALPVLVGVLTIVGALGLLQLAGIVAPVNAFANNVVTLIGLGLAIDYGLFVVSRFREEMASGYRPHDAARRAVATAGRTVVFSAFMVGVTLSGLIVFPQQFLKSVAYGAIAAVALAALLSVTLLPAVLALLGRRIDLLSIHRFRDKVATALRREEAPHGTAPGEEKGFFGRVADWAMRRPLAIVIPVVLVLLALIAPFANVKFGGINETYLPPDNPTRVAQEAYDQAFPDSRTDPVKLVIRGADATQISDIRDAANAAPGLVGSFQFAHSGALDSSGQEVTVLQASVVDRNRSDETVKYLQTFPIPQGTEVYVGGNPALEYDSVQALMDGLPVFVLYVFVATTILLFLAFGSLVLPLKAAIMNLLGLGATLGVLTWIFVDGHGAGLLGFTAGPLTSPVVVLLVAIIYGLSTDYEVFLLSRMVEARAQGASTRVAIRSGIARTGQIITSAALILIVVTGAFAFSEIVMMKYIAFGMMAALILDATVIRMLLVPAVMTLLGPDCWWAPKWMKRIQHRIGLSEAELEDEPHIRDDVVAAKPVADTAPDASVPEPLSAEFERPRGLKSHGSADAHRADRRRGGADAHRADRRRGGADAPHDAEPRRNSGTYGRHSGSGKSVAAADLIARLRNESRD